MLHNRSVPMNVMLPHVYYEDPAAALAWLQEAFGFEEQYRFSLPDGTLHGALIRREDAWVMLKSLTQAAASPARIGGYTQNLMLFVENIEAHYERALAAGARISEALNVTEYGEQQYVAEDPEGHPWMFAKHVRDVPPEAWGAVPR
ncbi:VOC family protein [Paenibacillus glycinis]|uniref:Glyoxalase n=1 Tax=Paenibacillus glycinis TaxID=2697035 RepID=A0ABW9XWR2_9BACL|nr:VOC family protein [Paenibacillus glycinis]NBD27140.1 glyoxalase [Paenibacillus glycinis]